VTGDKPIEYFRPYVNEGLESSIKSKDLKELILCLRYSKMLNTTTFKEKEMIETGIKLFKELKLKEIIQKKFAEALKEQDIFVLYQLSKEYPMGAELKPNYYKLMNERLISMKIGEFIENFDFTKESHQNLTKIFEKAKKWGMKDQIEELEIQLLNKIQLDNCIKTMRTCQNSTEIYPLTLALMQGRNLGNSTKEENKLIEMTQERLSFLHEELKYRVDIQNIKTIEALNHFEKNGRWTEVSLESQNRLKKDFEIAKERIEKDEEIKNWTNSIHKEIKNIKTILRNSKELIDLSILANLKTLLQEDMKFNDPELISSTFKQVEMTIEFQLQKEFDNLKPTIEQVFQEQNEKEIENILIKYQDFPHQEMKFLLSKGSEVWLC
jgi:hypothetical protein